MIAVPTAPGGPHGKAIPMAAGNGGCVTSCSQPKQGPVAIRKQTSSESISSEKNATCTSSPNTPQRRAIFNAFWQKSATVTFKDDDTSEGSTGRETKYSEHLGPSYLGIYSFAPSPLVSPKPVLGPASSDSSDSSTASPGPPKSILRRQPSLRGRRVDSGQRPNLGMVGRSKSASLVTGAETHIPISFVPPLLQDDQPDESEPPRLGRRHTSAGPFRSSVHFDPTITVREVIGEASHHEESESNWFNDRELGSFMAEAINLCQLSAVNAMRTYSHPAVAKAYAEAHEAGIMDPVVSSTIPGNRALFSDPVLHATDEDAIIYDGSSNFFKIMSREVQSLLIVDNSPITLKLFQRHIMSMFPHIHVDMALSGEDALSLIGLAPDQPPHVYDIIIAAERLYLPPFEVEYMEEKLEDDSHHFESGSLSGSELLRIINDIETSALEQNNSKNSRAESSKDESDQAESPLMRKSLKIGVSETLGEDCDSLLRGGADLFWSKPPPKPSNYLRNQLLNTLLNKRGKSVFVCGR